MAVRRGKLDAATSADGEPTGRPAQVRSSVVGQAPWAARRPTQERSRKRYDAVLAAADELLLTANIEDISFYDLARKADIPPASVHYLFPSMAAIQSELRNRYNTEISDLLVEFHATMAERRVPTWQEWLRIEASEARDYYSRTRPACEVLLGPLLHRGNREASLQGNAQVGASNLANMKRIFLVPEMPGLEAKFARNCAIIETFWSTSYLATGTISDFAFDESIRAAAAYLRNFLPEMLAPQPAEARLAS